MKIQEEIDIIILSYAANDALFEITSQCVASLFASENPELIKFNTIVIESNQLLAPYNYSNTQTIYPKEPFGYHRYMNIGIKQTRSAYVCICNNDLIFREGWATAIIQAMKKFPYLSSASPMSSNYHPYTGMNLEKEIVVGLRVGYEIAGWCLFFRRSMLKQVGILDENYIFSGADYDYAYNLWVLNFKHALITTSVVDHLTAQTIGTESAERQYELTQQVTYHLKKWTHRVSLKN